MSLQDDEAIARTLAGEQPYSSMYGFIDSDSAEEDRPKKRRAGRKASRGKKAKPCVTDTAQHAVQPATQAQATPCEAIQPGIPFSMEAGVSPPINTTADNTGPQTEPAGSCPDLHMDKKLASGKGAQQNACKREIAPGRPWSFEEEALFQKSLETHGRDWRAAAALIGSRDARQVSSHAQKSFIKLCMQGKPLPPKVCLSGEGYTLSGRPLDPTSASALAYGFNPLLLARLEADCLAQAKRGLLVAHLPRSLGGEAEEPTGDKARVSRQHSRPAPATAPSCAPTPVTHTSSDPGTATFPPLPHRLVLPTAPLGAMGASLAMHGTLAQPGACDTHATPCDAAAMAAEANQGAAAEPAVAAAAPSQTEYARQRPRREGAGGRMHGMLAATSESTQLLRPFAFVGQPGSGAPLAQPFAMEMHAHALVVMDFHAHLSGFEVIGLLGGRWDAAARSLTVSRAYPCRRAAGSSALTSVEICPCAQVDALAAMTEAGDHCVGTVFTRSWYHSHPVFQPTPSQADLDNQHNYQRLFRQADSKVEPFVGVIVGPWDTSLPSPLSASTVFVAHNRPGSRALQPYSVRYVLTGAHELPGPAVTLLLCGLLDEHREDEQRWDFTQEWRGYTGLSREGGHVGPPVSRVTKLQTSLAQFLVQVRDTCKLVAWLESLAREIESRWHVQLPDTPVLQQQGQENENSACQSQNCTSVPTAGALLCQPLALAEDGLVDQAAVGDACG